MRIQVGIIQYGLGNTASVLNAFQALGADASVVSESNNLTDFSHIVLPGVGSFKKGMENLINQGWAESLSKQILEKKKPFLGICLGMQVLASKGTEHGDCPGLGWLEGEVRQLTKQQGELRLPHIGWNEVTINREDANYALTKNKSPNFYFVHSYAFYPKQITQVDGWCEYGTKFAASLCQENIRAVQYHPEKSQKEGLLVLKSFIDKN